MSKSAGVSLASLDARKVGETPVEFEFLDDEGASTGVYFAVLGGQSPQVTAETQRLVNERRRSDAAAEIRSRTGGRKAEVTFIPVEDDLAFNQRLTAIRLVGWRGIVEDFTPERGLHLIQSNRDVAAQIMEASDRIGRFTTSSPTAS